MFVFLYGALSLHLLPFLLASALPAPTSILPAHIVWQPSTPKNAWLECITSRSNGDLLITRYDSGEIWTVNTATEVASLVYKFPSGANVNASLGIVEYQDDVFAFNGGQTTAGDRMPIDGSWSVWSLDLRGWVPSADNNSQQIPSVSRISAVPEAKMLNGIAVLNPATTTGPRAKGNDSEPLLLLADSTRGIIYSIDVAASNSSTNVFYSNPDLLAPTADAAFPTGLNGLQLPPVRNPKHVYFTTGFHGTFFRLELSQTSPAVAPAAEPELLAKGYENLDDFALDADGTAYLSTSVAREIVRVTPSGEETVIFQGDLVSSGTATLLVERDGKKILYVNTGSASNFGDGIPGKLVEIWL